MKKIPTVIETYEANSEKPKRELHDEPWHYNAAEGEVILVHLWVRYPSYDFIFGTPHPDNPKYQKEFGFFQFRKKKDGEPTGGWQVYVDQSELEEMQKGFTRLMDTSHATRTEEWQKYHAAKEL